MKRKVAFLATVMALMVGLISTVAVTAERGNAPHDGECVAYCARAGVFIDGERRDMDGDGKTESCLVELKCHKFSEECGMVDPSYKPNPCWPTCVVVHGPGSPWKGH